MHVGTIFVSLLAACFFFQLAANKSKVGVNSSYSNAINSDFCERNSYTHFHVVAPSEALKKFEIDGLNAASRSCEAGYYIAERLVRNKIHVHVGLFGRCPLKQVTNAFLNYYICIPRSSHDHVVHMYVYIDGGFFSDHENHSTWSASIVVEWASGRIEIVVSAGGFVSFDPISASLLGECSPPSAFCSELFAQAIARIMIFQFAHKYAPCVSTPISIVYDSTSSAIPAERGPISLTQPSLSRLCNIIDNLCKYFSQRVLHTFTIIVAIHLTNTLIVYALTCATSLPRRLCWSDRSPSKICSILIYS